MVAEFGLGLVYGWVLGWVGLLVVVLTWFWLGLVAGGVGLGFGLCLVGQGFVL